MLTGLYLALNEGAELWEVSALKLGVHMYLQLKLRVLCV